MKILFPTDFSNAAENAFIFALRLAKQLKAPITVLHVYTLPDVSPWLELPDINKEVNDLVTSDEFDAFKTRIDTLKRIASENNLSDIDINYSLRESAYVVNGIVDEAKDMNADLMIMGTNGASGFKKAVFGSVALKTMEESSCPVLLVPDKAFFKGIIDIGLTLEYLPEEKELVRHALAFAIKINGHLDCFHVDSGDHNKMKSDPGEWQEEFKHDSHISFHTHYSLDEKKGIIEYCKQKHLDMLVMRAHQRNFIRELFSSSLAIKVAYDIHIPLLTLHLPETV
ncbi:MAG: universal stress protein [Saprospiraceae bacterium]